MHFEKLIANNTRKRLGGHMARQKHLTSHNIDAVMEGDALSGGLPPGEPRNLEQEPASGLLRKRRLLKSPKIRVKSSPSGPVKVDMEPVDAERLLSIFGAADPGFVNLMLSGVINASCDKRTLEAGEVNDALAAVTSIGAEDGIEGMLATQMVATHLAGIGALRRLRGSETVAQQDSNGNLAVKLLRIFTMQIEALQRYRGKGQQKVTVEHVNVNAGGQAIVGSVHPAPVNKTKDPS